MKQRVARLTIALMAILFMFGGGLLRPADTSFGCGFFVGAAQAQESASLAVGGDVPSGPPTTLGDYWKASGITGWPLLGIAIWITALVIELLMRARMKILCPPDTISQLSSTLAVQDYVKAWQFSVANPSPLSRVMAPVIENIPKGVSVATDVAYEGLNLQNNVFKTKCSYLNLHATVSTLLGLFGTITGMMGAFNKMAYSGATGDPSKLAGSISEALVTTWIGLALGISALALFYIFTNRTKMVMTSMQGTVMNLINEIDFTTVTPDMEIVTAEMKSRSMGGAGGAAAPAPVPAGAPRAAAKPAGEMAQCPHCQAQVQVGAAKCPNCKAELEWE